VRVVDVSGVTRVTVESDAALQRVMSYSDASVSGTCTASPPLTRVAEVYAHVWRRARHYTCPNCKNCETCLVRVVDVSGVTRLTVESYAALQHVMSYSDASVSGTCTASPPLTRVAEVYAHVWRRARHYTCPNCGNCETCLVRVADVSGVTRVTVESDAAFQRVAS
jgi:predicted RNA-binding Zn-ribbon protein involved in translation (DUF1610 family)